MMHAPRLTLVMLLLGPFSFDFLGAARVEGVKALACACHNLKKNGTLKNGPSWGKWRCVLSLTPIALTLCGKLLLSTI